MTSGKKTRLLKNSVIALLGSATLAFAASAANPQNQQYGNPYQDSRVQNRDWTQSLTTRNTGLLNILAPVPGAGIFVDGTFIGTTGQVQDIPMLPGSHNVDLRAADGRTLYGASIAIKAGETITLRPPINGISSQSFNFLPNVPNSGNVVIQMPNSAANLDDVSVFVDGRYMGLASQMNNVPLPAGTHSFELRAPDGRVLYQNTVAVAAGEATDIRPTFEAGAAFVPEHPEFVPGGASGFVKLSSVGRNVAIFVDGEYIGTTNRVKQLVLTPGVHNISLADQDGQLLYQDNVSVLSGKTTRLHPFPNG